MYSSLRPAEFGATFFACLPLVLAGCLPVLAGDCAPGGCPAGGACVEGVCIPGDAGADEGADFSRDAHPSDAAAGRDGAASSDGPDPDALPTDGEGAGDGPLGDLGADAAAPSDAGSDGGSPDAELPDGEVADRPLPDGPGGDACVGEEVCNGLDDDCDGLVDEDLQGRPDAPDPDFLDANCDGVDGVAEGAVFVSTRPVDAPRDGSRGAPFADLLVATAIAAERGVPVLLDEGEHVVGEPLRLEVSVHGGYRAADGWTRAPRAAAPSTILGAPTAIVYEGLGAPLVLDNLVVRAADAEPGGTSYAVVAAEVGEALTLRDVHLVAGQGGAGDPGAEGEVGVAGVDGVAGVGALGGPGGALRLVRTAAGAARVERVGGWGRIPSAAGPVPPESASAILTRPSAPRLRGARGATSPRTVGPDLQPPGGPTVSPARRPRATGGSTARGDAGSPPTGGTGETASPAEGAEGAGAAAPTSRARAEAVGGAAPVAAARGSVGGGPAGAARSRSSWPGASSPSSARSWRLAMVGWVAQAAPEGSAEPLGWAAPGSPATERAAAAAPAGAAATAGAAAPGPLARGARAWPSSGSPRGRPTRASTTRASSG